MEDLLPAPLLAQGFPAGEAAGGNGRFANRPYRGGALRRQQPADGVFDRLALRRLAQPFAELAAGDGDGDAVAFLAELRAWETSTCIHHPDGARAMISFY